MGTILARSILMKTGRILVDQDGVRWPLDEMLGWLNTGQREIVLLRPDAASRTHKFQLQAGTKQEVPPLALRLLDVIRNDGEDGDTPGRTIRFVDREILDAQHPEWHAGQPAPNARAMHWTYDEREPRTFYVFPAQPVAGRGFITVIISVSPEPCTLVDVQGDDGVVGVIDSPISIADIFEGALIDYVRYRALLKEAEYAGDEGKANQAYSKFMTALGLKTETDKRFTARRNAPPHVNPNVPGNAGAFGD